MADPVSIIGTGIRIFGALGALSGKDPLNVPPAVYQKWKLAGIVSVKQPRPAPISPPPPPPPTSSTPPPSAPPGQPPIFYPPVPVGPSGGYGPVAAPEGQRGGTFDPSKWPAGIRKVGAKLLVLMERGFIPAWVLSEILNAVQQYRLAEEAEDRAQAARIKEFLDGVRERAAEREKAAVDEKRRAEDRADADRRVREQIDAANARAAARAAERAATEAKRDAERVAREAKREHDEFLKSLELKVPKRLRTKRPTPRSTPRPAALGRILSSDVFSFGTALLRGRDQQRSQALGIVQLDSGQAIDFPLVDPLSSFQPSAFSDAELLAQAGGQGAASTSDQVCSCRPRYVKRKRKNPREKRICYTRKV
jgi:hypothetical protein